MHTRRPILLLVIQLVLVATAIAASQPPNIVFIFADDWGWGDLACHGHPHVRTPNIDRLAAEGIDFHQFNVCNPVCSPSRTAAMTGLFPARYSVHQHFADREMNRQRGMPDWLDPKVVMLPRLLQQAGYRTGHFGKWHLTHETIPDAPRVKDYGFDDSAVYNGPPPRANHDTLIDKAVEFIKASKDGPFYVNVWLHETHTPHYPSKELLAHYDGLDEQHRVYAAIVEEGDRKVGRILDTLRELKLDDHTLVIFSGDNGPEWTAPKEGKQLRDGLGTYYSVGTTNGLRGRKRSLFEGGVRTPFIVRWPGNATAGAKNESTVIAAVDLLPTLCAAAGVSLPSDYRPDGESMLPAFKGKPIARTKPIFWEWRGTSVEPDWWPRLAVRDGDWKLLEAPDAERAELYNLANDRQESKNLADAELDRVARMTQLLAEWRSTLPTSPPADCISKQRDAPPAAKPRAAQPQKPNILFILADDQRHDTIHALGNSEIQTPNLDRLAESGFHFTNAYCMGSMTPAVCLPSRTMLLTGRSLWRLPAVTGLQAPPDVALLPRVLREAGYLTYHCGKSNNACRYGHAAFDVNVETEKNGPDDMKLHGDRIVRFLREHDRKQPFFIYLAPSVPHDPRVAPERFKKLYDASVLTLSRNFMLEHPFDNGELKIRDELLAAHPRRLDDIRQHLADYYACISDLDDQVGRLLDTIRELGYAENTIVIFSSDQGLAVGGRHGLMGKQNLYEHVKPPLIFAGPGIPHGKSDALVYLFDLFPTICDLAHEETPAIVEGKSLLPIIRGETADVRKYLFTAYRDWQRMVRDERWKLIEYVVGGERHTQLFDLSTDLDELDNLAECDGSAEVLARLRRELRRMGAEFGDPVTSFYTDDALGLRPLHGRSVAVGTRATQQLTP